MNYYSQPVQKIYDIFNSGSQGLSLAQVNENSKISGANIIIDSGQKTFSQMLKGQITDFMILLLLFAAGVSFFIGDVVDGAIILVIVSINAALGIYQEYQAEKAISSLKILVSGPLP